MHIRLRVPGWCIFGIRISYKKQIIILTLERKVSNVATLQGEESENNSHSELVAHAPRRAQGVCGETRRCNLFRTTKIRFYPTIFATFCFLAELGAQKGAKSALRGHHQPIDFRPFRTPSRGIAAFFAKWTLFAHRSLLLHCTARETDGGTTDRVIDAFAPFEGLALRYIEDDRSSCSIGVLAAFDGL